MVSQQYEEQSGQDGEILETYSNYGENGERSSELEAFKGSCGQGNEEGESAHEGNSQWASWYGCPVSTVQVEAMRKTGVAVKTQEQNNWAASVWHDWATY